MQPLATPPTKALAFRFADRVLFDALSGRKSERTRASLQAATCRLLEALPPRELKVSDICSEAGVAHGTFYVYFRDIRHLMADTLTAYVDFMQQAMRQTAKGRTGDRSRSTTAAYVSLFRQNAGLMRCLVSALDDFPEATEAFQKLNREWTSIVVDARLRRLARENCLAPPARDELLRRAYALGGMVDQYLIMLLFGRDKALAEVSKDYDAVVDTLSLIWDRGMDP